ncbi:MAG: hypothetical protein U1F67_06045 [Rubrivivax sp.]
MGEDQGDETLITQAKRLGAPLLVKAVAGGGGGRGMRLLRDAADLAALPKHSPAHGAKRKAPSATAR